MNEPGRKTVEIQKELFAERSPSEKYRQLIVGQPGWWPLIKYELITGFAGWMPGALGLFLRSKLYPKLLKKAGRNITFGVGVVLRHPHKIVIGDNVVIDDHCVLDAKGETNEGISIGSGVFLGRSTILNCKNGDIILGNGVNIGFNSMIFSASRVEVGDRYLIAAYCYLVGGTHNADDPARPVLDQGRTSKGIILGGGGWLGAHVTVFDGVRIGKNTVIAGGAVVHRNIPDYAVAGGNPVTIINKRNQE
jgi:acetyltransferase-like isoleucine patch superfamily enzyme